MSLLPRLPLVSVFALAAILFTASCAPSQPAAAPPPAAVPGLTAEGLECGNLAGWRTREDGVIEFNVRPDTKAPDEWRWYYFRVADAKGQRLRLRLLNAGTASAATAWSYNQPVVSADGGRTWTRVTDDKYDGTTFEFSFTPQSDGDLVALSPVYTYSRALDQIAEWRKNPRVRSCEVIARSVQDREIHRLVVTGNERKERPIIWIIARQHPSETGGSWKFEGFMEWLLSEDADATALVDAYEFHLVPCMNPDGVVLGNYRRNAEGLNLNRVWDDPDPARAPEVHAVRAAMLADRDAGHHVAFFVDLHSFSSIRANFFLYNDEFTSKPGYPEEIERFMDTFESINSDFSKSRSDAADGSEKGIAKNWAYSTFEVPSLTFESSYQDVTYGPNKGAYMTVERYKALGRDLGIALKKHLLVE